MPSRLPDIDYDTLEFVRKVPKDRPVVSFKGKSWRVPKAFRGEYVAVRPTGNDTYAICFGARPIATIDLAHK
jgi:hypothetical protein